MNAQSSSSILYPISLCKVTLSVSTQSVQSHYLHPFRILITFQYLLSTSLFSISSQRYQMSVFQFLFAKISDVSISVSLRKDIRCQYFSFSSQRYQMSVFQYLFAKISDVHIFSLFAKISDVRISVSLRKDIRCQYFSISSQRSHQYFSISLWKSIVTLSRSLRIQRRLLLYVVRHHIAVNCLLVNDSYVIVR